MVQVYNERIFDLLNEGLPPLEGWRHLELKEDAHGRVFVDGLKEVSHCFASINEDFSSLRHPAQTTGLHLCADLKPLLRLAIAMHL